MSVRFSVLCCVSRFCRRHRRFSSPSFHGKTMPLPTSITDGSISYFQTDDVLVPAHLESQSLYRERWYCIVARSSKLPKRLSLKHYLDAEHVAVSVLDGVQTIPDKRLAALGYTRRSAICVPYFGTALECIPQTNLVLTGTSSVVRAAKLRPDLRVIEAPVELTGFSFQQVWHPRLNTDLAQRWLRQEMLLAGRQLKL